MVGQKSEKLLTIAYKKLNVGVANKDEGCIEGPPNSKVRNQIVADHYESYEVKKLNCNYILCFVLGLSLLLHLWIRIVVFRDPRCLRFGSHYFFNYILSIS